MSKTLITLGTDEEPVADLMVDHVKKEYFRKIWNDEWEGDTPTDDSIEYMYGTEDAKGTWTIGVDATAQGAVPITVFVW
ncbi:MAG: hypothetical protein ACREJM_02940 [Candidatus Saccharimonadales bacterium]